jgi:putative transposase
VSTKYKTQAHKLYYVTLTVVGWMDVFTRKEYVNIVFDSIRYCQANKGLELYAYVVMPIPRIITAPSSPAPPARGL